MSDEAPQLDRIERWMQAVITHPGGIVPGMKSPLARGQIELSPAELEQVILPSQNLSSQQRLAIYSTAYFARLLECLSTEFPVFAETVGEDAFAQFAIEYLQEHPSRSYTLGRLGEHFPQYLQDKSPSAEAAANDPAAADWAGFLVDLARLEWAISQVFDGPGVEGQPLLDATGLESMPAEHWPEARLVPVICLRLLQFRYPVNEYFTQVRRKQPAVPGPRQETYVAITRRQFVVRRWELTPVEFVLLEALVAGKTMGEAISVAAGLAGGTLDELATDLQDWFRDWTAQGFFQRLELSGGE